MSLRTICPPAASLTVLNKLPTSHCETQMFCRRFQWRAIEYTLPQTAWNHSSRGDDT
jgi:hypothetical protein